MTIKFNRAYLLALFSAASLSEKEEAALSGVTASLPELAGPAAGWLTGAAEPLLGESEKASMEEASMEAVSSSRLSGIAAAS